MFIANVSLPSDRMHICFESKYLFSCFTHSSSVLQIKLYEAHSLWFSLYKFTIPSGYKSIYTQSYILLSRVFASKNMCAEMLLTIGVRNNILFVTITMELLLKASYMGVVSNLEFSENTFVQRFMCAWYDF